MKKTNHFSCENCDRVFCIDYSNDNKICSGIVKKPMISYDVIRLCIITNGEATVTDSSPDEIGSIITVLSHSLNDWMMSRKTYEKFREDK
jgi:hypothetical protein